MKLASCDLAVFWLLLSGTLDLQVKWGHVFLFLFELEVQITGVPQNYFLKFVAQMVCVVYPCIKWPFMDEKCEKQSWFWTIMNWDWLFHVHAALCASKQADVHRFHSNQTHKHVCTHTHTHTHTQLVQKVRKPPIIPILLHKKPSVSPLACLSSAKDANVCCYRVKFHVHTAEQRFSKCRILTCIESKSICPSDQMLRQQDNTHTL